MIHLLEWREGELLDGHAFLGRFVAPKVKNVLSFDERDLDRLRVLPDSFGKRHLHGDLRSLVGRDLDPLVVVGGDHLGFEGIFTRLGRLHLVPESGFDGLLGSGRIRLGAVCIVVFVVLVGVVSKSES